MLITHTVLVIVISLGFGNGVTVCRVGVDYSCQLNILAWKIFCVQNRTLTKT